MIMIGGTAAPEDANKCKRELEQAAVQGWHQGQLFFYRCCAAAVVVLFCPRNGR